MKIIPEADWKKLRDIRPRALNRLCTRILNDARQLCQSEKAKDEPHATYLQLFKLVDEGDDSVADLFNDWRRSTVYIVLLGW